ncbi:MAG: hypothetical protein HDS21_07885 [Bacteroides sp.]|nr:hypothetical protein [Bacteroides sp.]
MDSKFFNLIRPLTNYIDSGRFFSQPLQCIYYVFGILCLLIPFYVIYELADWGFFSYANGKELLSFFVVIIGLLGVCILCFLLWFNRAEKLSTLLSPNSKFVAVPAVANLIQTGGEVFGIFMGVFGFYCSLFYLLLDTRFFFIPNDIYHLGIMGVIVMPIFGYVIVVGSRYLAELVLSIADIANNTDKIANK